MTSAADAEGSERFRVVSSARFGDWLQRAGVALAVSTYQAGKLFLFGATSAGQVTVFERTLARCMGLGVGPRGDAFAVATDTQIMRFDDVLDPAQGSPLDGAYQGADALYAPHATWITGALDVHDVAWPPDERPMFVNTLFSCIAAVSDRASFRPLWRPAFISGLAPEDRCHLNGLALEAGRPRWVTAVASSDVPAGWRDDRESGGLLLDMAADGPIAERVLEGLSMPHSPRVQGDKVWLLNSGRGELGWVDTSGPRARFMPVAFCPGYPRGLALVGRYAVVALSRPREQAAFRDLPLEAALRSHGTEARCGLIVIDTISGETVAWLRIEGLVRELYDVAVLPNRRRPAMVGVIGDDIRRTFSVEGA